MRTRINLRIADLWFVQSMSGDREKGKDKEFRYSYPEPAQVPLGEKPKV